MLQNQPGRTAALTLEFVGSVACYTSISVVACMGMQICLMGKVPNSIYLKLQALIQS